MLRHTLQTGCVSWQNASPTIALLWLCITSLHTFFSWSFLILNHLDRKSLQNCFHQHFNHFFIQLIYLLFHFSVMHYFFVRSLLENTLVTIELRNLRCRLFSHFRYICRFSLTIFIWFFAWMDNFVRWLKNRVIRFSIASSQWRSCWCSWEGNLFFRQGQEERIRKVRFVRMT